MTTDSAPTSAAAPGGLSYERPTFTDDAAVAATARNVLLLLIRLAGLGFVVLGVWGSLDWVKDLLSGWASGPGFPRGPMLHRTLWSLVFRELDVYAIGILLLVLSEPLARWLMPRRWWR